MNEIKVPKELLNNLEKAQSKVLAAKKKIAAATKAQRAKATATARLQAQRKDEIMLDMFKTTLTAQEIFERLDKYLVFKADRDLFDLVTNPTANTQTAINSPPQGGASVPHAPVAP
jgi:hypothetical protein